MLEKDVVTWNVLISGYVQNGEGDKALHACRLMRPKSLRSSEEGVRYDSRQGVTYLLYNAMISGCALYDQAVEALAPSQRIKEEDLKPTSNTYAAAGRWDEVQKGRQLVKKGGLRKVPGFGWIQIGELLNVFVAGDKSHPETAKIYTTLALMRMETSFS
ncbi:pentatricopeptide repeat-containing protein [Pyrus ussuriensis x Pyrus communis]|uniref:Pentatricopeptide repeat-containing protein n=1 Tax=Pyrus ussuriensis x Pyrus communis TaxID=2448454 RepID=A0A5N5GTX0_9ROSA|nr:pentatricopeptide repeat-containing protein [Pyrus ussuriensis x Pyrus communis]